MVGVGIFHCRDNRGSVWFYWNCVRRDDNCACPLCHLCHLIRLDVDLAICHLKSYSFRLIAILLSAFIREIDVVRSIASLSEKRSKMRFFASSRF